MVIKRLFVHNSTIFASQQQFRPLNHRLLLFLLFIVAFSLSLTRTQATPPPKPQKPTHTLQPYLDAVRATLTAAVCLENFSSQVVERHNKPEVEVRSVVWCVRYEVNSLKIKPRGPAYSYCCKPQWERESIHWTVHQCSTCQHPHQTGRICCHIVSLTID